MLTPHTHTDFLPKSAHWTCAKPVRRFCRDNFTLSCVPETSRIDSKGSRAFQFCSLSFFFSLHLSLLSSFFLLSTSLVSTTHHLHSPLQPNHSDGPPLLLQAVSSSLLLDKPSYSPINHTFILTSINSLCSHHKQLHERRHIHPSTHQRRLICRIRERRHPAQHRKRSIEL